MQGNNTLEFTTLPQNVLEPNWPPIDRFCERIASHAHVITSNKSCTASFRWEQKNFYAAGPPPVPAQSLSHPNKSQRADRATWNYRSVDVAAAAQLDDATESGSEDATLVIGLEANEAKSKATPADDVDAAAAKVCDDSTGNGLENDVTNGLEAQGAKMLENDTGDATVFGLL